MRSEPLREQTWPEVEEPESRDLTRPIRFGLMVGSLETAASLFSMLRRVAASNVTCLIEGETGTGKEATAESIHMTGPRKGGPFITVDCGAIPSLLLESELFGYERGAFTGAVAARQGAFEAASGGTIFLDEIGELSLELQPKILRVLERHQIKRVGSNHYSPVDVRVLAATNRSLRHEVSAARFRSDLYYRLAVVRVSLPPLRERLDDLPGLVDHVLRSLGVLDTPEAAMMRDPSYIAMLAQYHWPGNVRQLRNFLERAVTLGDVDTPPDNDSIPPPAAAPSSQPPPSPVLSSRAAGPPSSLSGAAAAVQEELPRVDVDQPFKEARAEWIRSFERRYLQEMLVKHEHNVSAAARAAGIDRVRFYRLLWKHGLKQQEAGEAG